jgi:hypothetical protein
MTVCPNCGCDRLEKFCPECGQENVPSTVPVRELLYDLLGDLFKVDTRLWGTLWPLLSRPGFLTQEYLVGRRARYLTPLKLYLSVGFVYFLLFSWTIGPVIHDLNMATQNRTSLARPPRASSTVKGKRRTRIVQRLNSAMNWQTANQGTINLYLIPIFALSMAIVFRRRRRLFMEHVVFLLHSQSAVYLLSLPLLPLLRNPTLLLTLSLLPSIVYYPLAIRRVYAPLSWPKTVLAALAHSVLSLIFIYAVMLPLLIGYFLWPWGG